MHRPFDHGGIRRNHDHHDHAVDPHSQHREAKIARPRFGKGPAAQVADSVIAPVLTAPAMAEQHRSGDRHVAQGP